MPHPLIQTEREKARSMIVLGMRSLADALWNDAQITSDEIGLQALTSGAVSVREIVREVATKAAA